MTGPVAWLERRLTLVEGYAQEAAQRFPGACWPSDALEVVAFGAVEFVEEVAAPENMLRLVAGAREILAEHRPIACDEFTCDCHRCCATCRWTEADEAAREPVWGDVTRHVYPCRTVLLLAQAWGWEEEQRG